jgi:hypothetical protein
MRPAWLPGGAGYYDCLLSLHPVVSQRRQHTRRRGQNGRSPRVRRVTFVPYTRRIYGRTLRVISGFRLFGSLAPDADASCASCTSGRHFAYSFLQTPPRDDALAVR